MKTLLCLLSDQHVPNLLAVHHFQPDRLVLVESAGMQRKRASVNLLAALKLGKLDYHDRCRVQTLADENDLEAIRRCLCDVLEQEHADEWIVNLTGGTKPMSIGAYDIFLQQPARLIYAAVNQPDRFLDFRGRDPETCSYRPTIEEFLAGYGFQFPRALKDILDEENMLRFLPRLAQQSTRRCPDGPLRLCLTSAKAERDWWSQARRKGVRIEAGEVTIPDALVRSEVCRAFQLSAQEEHVTGHLSNRGAKFLTGGWLEVLLWDLLTRHQDALQAWDVRLGPEIRHAYSQVNNEFDIAFMHGYTLSWIECKSGTQEHDPKADILYKVEAVTRQIGALRARAFLATTGQNILDTGRDGQLRVKPHIEHRASLYQCRILTRQQLQQLAENPDDADLVRRTFFPTPTE